MSRKRVRRTFCANANDNNNYYFSYSFHSLKLSNAIPVSGASPRLPFGECIPPCLHIGLHQIAECKTSCMKCELLRMRNGRQRRQQKKREQWKLQELQSHDKHVRGTEFNLIFIGSVRHASARQRAAAESPQQRGLSISCHFNGDARPPPSSLFYNLLARRPCVACAKCLLCATAKWPRSLAFLQLKLIWNIKILVLVSLSFSHSARVLVECIFFLPVPLVFAWSNVCLMLFAAFVSNGVVWRNLLKYAHNEGQTTRRSWGAVKSSWHGSVCKGKQRRSTAKRVCVSEHAAKRIKIENKKLMVTVRERAPLYPFSQVKIRWDGIAHTFSCVAESSTSKKRHGIEIYFVHWIKYRCAPHTHVEIII